VSTLHRVSPNERLAKAPVKVGEEVVKELLHPGVEPDRVARLQIVEQVREHCQDAHHTASAVEGPRGPYLCGRIGLPSITHAASCSAASRCRRTGRMVDHTHAYDSFLGRVQSSRNDSTIVLGDTNKVSVRRNPTAITRISLLCSFSASCFVLVEKKRTVAWIWVQWWLELRIDRWD